MEMKNYRNQMETILACNYAPGGNLVIRPKQTASIYEIGKPCSKCSSREHCYSGALCA